MSSAALVLIDNSEFMRSGDYTPTRFQAQADAVNLLAGAMTQAHPENTIGVLTMSGKTPRVLVTPTSDLGKVLNCMSDIELESAQLNFSSAVQIAQLALKHRQNKNQRQRIVIFIGSPISEDKETLVKIAKKLKKNSVAVDVVSFGSETENEEKVEAFHQAVNSNNNSYLVTVPPGPVLSDVLISSQIFQGEGGSGYGFGVGGAGGGGGGEGGEGFEFGIDPNIDPDLALALRVSLEEERARQNAAGGEAAGGTSTAAVPVAASDMDLDEDALLQQALAMSMQVDLKEDGSEQPPAAAVPGVTGPVADAAMLEEIEDEELKKALEMSMEEDKK